LALLVLSGVARADESASDIAKKARDQGSLNLVGLEAQMKLSNVEADGSRKDRDVLTQSKKIDGLTHTLTRFKSPPDVAGVALLSIDAPPGGSDQISLYLPKIRRARRIAQSNRGESFMESEFTYADFSGGGIDPDNSKRGPDDTYNGKPTFQLTGTPKDSAYSKVVCFIDKATYIPVKVDYYDDKGLLKEYSVQKIEVLQGRTLATQSMMENKRTGRKTIVSISQVAPVQAPDTAFSERALERG
jgi:hypothetical protein